MNADDYVGDFMGQLHDGMKTNQQKQKSDKKLNVYKTPERLRGMYGTAEEYNCLKKHLSIYFRLRINYLDTA